MAEDQRRARGEQHHDAPLVQHSRCSGLPFECRTTAHPALLDDAALLDVADDLVAAGVTHWVLQVFRVQGATASSDALRARAHRRAVRTDCSMSCVAGCRLRDVGERRTAGCHRPPSCRPCNSTTQEDREHTHRHASAPGHAGAVAREVAHHRAVALSLVDRADRFQPASTP